MTELLERLGNTPGDRVVIINCNGLGLSNAANLGCYQSLREGLATSASLMMPCAWARVAAIDYRGEDVGVDLTLNAEYDRYRWAPLTASPSLLDGDGGFPRTTSDMWDHADLDEVRRECRAQIERAVLWGIDVTHLGNHLNAMQLRPEFFDIYLDLALEFRVPIRLEGKSEEATAGFHFKTLAEEEGVLSPDHVVSLSGDASGAAADTSVVDIIAELPAGVTELVLRPAVDTPELRAISDDYPDRVQDFALLKQHAEVSAGLNEVGAFRTNWRALKALMV